jgi:DNA-binding transcriptional regulator YdaS (Cro superfamily)
MRQRTKLRDPGLTEALERAQTARRLAELLSDMGDPISVQAVAKWERCPSARCLDVERATGVSRYRLRPDIYGEEPKPKGRSQRPSDTLRVA